MALPTSDSASTSLNTSNKLNDSQADSSTGSVSSDADMAQAFRDLARGEQTALALESNLTSLERKLDDFLASFEETERQKAAAVDGNKPHSSTEGRKP